MQIRFASCLTLGIAQTSLALPSLKRHLGNVKLEGDMTNKTILFDSRGFMGDPVLRSCSAEAIGVLYLITMTNPSGKLQLDGNEEYMKMLRRLKPRARLRLLADTLNEQYPTTKPTQTRRGLFELYDRGVISVEDATVSVVSEHNYVQGTE